MDNTSPCTNCRQDIKCHNFARCRRWWKWFWPRWEAACDQIREVAKNGKEEETQEDPT